MSLGPRQLSAWAVCLLSVVVLGAAAAEPTAKEESAEARTVRRLVEQLGSENVIERARAAGRLEEIGLPALKALRGATRSSDPQVRERATLLIVSIKEAVMGGCAQTFETTSLLDRTVVFGGLDDPKTSLSEAVEMLSKVYNLSFDINEKALRNDGVANPLGCQIVEANPIPLIKGELKKVVKSILARVPARSGATYLIRKNVVEITTNAAVRAELGMKKDDELLPLVWEYFCEDSLAEALDTLSENGGYNVVLDPRVRGKTRDTLVTARLINVPVDTAVRLVADMAGLGVVRGDNSFYVTSPENANRMKEEAPHRRPIPAPGTP
jgi:hypothetical protein